MTETEKRPLRCEVSTKGARKGLASHPCPGAPLFLSKSSLIFFSSKGVNARRKLASNQLLPLREGTGTHVGSGPSFKGNKAFKAGASLRVEPGCLKYHRGGSGGVCLGGREEIKDLHRPLRDP